MLKGIFHLRYSEVPDMPSNLLPLIDDEEDVSYNAESLFTNIPIKHTIE